MTDEDFLSIRQAVSLRSFNAYRWARIIAKRNLYKKNIDINRETILFYAISSNAVWWQLTSLCTVMSMLRNYVARTCRLRERYFEEVSQIIVQSRVKTSSQAGFSDSTWPVISEGACHLFIVPNELSSRLR